MRVFLTMVKKALKLFLHTDSSVSRREILLLAVASDWCEWGCGSMMVTRLVRYEWDSLWEFGLGVR
jgi:hypothetical protein